MSTRCPPPRLPLPGLQGSDIAPWDDYVLRIYSSKGSFATSWSAFRHFGPISAMRFDHQPAPRRTHPVRAVMYLAGRWTAADGHTADPLEVAVLESFQRTAVVDRTTNGPRYALWKPSRPLRLLQLSDSNWVARAGGNAALLSGPRGVSRAWSRAIYNEYPEVDGLIWSASVLPTGRSILLYERAEDAVPRFPGSDRALSEPFLQPALSRIASTYRLTLL